MTSRARHVAIYLLREHGNLSLAEIGRLLGGRDHSSIGHAYRKMQKAYAEDLALQREVQEITARAADPNCYSPVITPAHPTLCYNHSS